MIHQVSNLRVFKKILDDKNALAKVNSSKDLLAFINYILRKFFKEAQAKPMLLVEAFFPLNKSSWKEHSTYHSDEDSAQEEDLARIRANRVSRRCECRFVDRSAHQSVQLAAKIPAEVEFKPDRKLSWSEQMGVAIRCLLDDGKMHLITWLLEVRTVFWCPFTKRLFTACLLGHRTRRFDSTGNHPSHRRRTPHL
jgi:replication fork protection complex subunit Tof1/Swi1